MGLFARRRGERDVAPDLPDAAAQEASEHEDPAQRADDVPGPWDESEHPSTEGLVDLGALRIPARAGIKFGLELDRPGGQPVALTLIDQDSTMQLRVFAAPRTQGIWDDVREEMIQSVKDEGGSAELRQGRFGTEIMASVPAQTSQGKAGKRAMRVVGIDGPRWFVRAIVTGKAADNQGAARRLEDLLAGTVVVRGGEARPPRELLVLRAPGTGAPEPEASKEEGIGPLRRGPEIAEIR